MSKYVIWHCKIGGPTVKELPPGADAPMRSAVEAAFAKLTGTHCEANFSGWGLEWTEPELAVIENRLPQADEPATNALRILGPALDYVQTHKEQFGVGLGQDIVAVIAEHFPKLAAADVQREPVAHATFQSRVQPWLMECFGPMIAGDKEERNHRFLEEALELVQACGCTASEAHQLVDYVYGRPVGDKPQEAGGVMVTLAALCLAQRMDMHECGEVELARIWTKVEKIRAKQAAKPKHSPLPAHIEMQVEPVAWRHNLTHCLYDTEREVPLADGEEWAEPLYLAPQSARYADPQLCAFYDAYSWPDLVTAMEKHIEKLQNKLSIAPEQQWLNDAQREGIELAAKWVESRRDAFIDEHGYTDPATGTLEFGRGQHAEEKLEYVGELEEIAEGIRTMLAAAPRQESGQ